MKDVSKQVNFIKFKIKSVCIRYGWYTLYFLLPFLILGFVNPLFFIGMAASLIPIWLLSVEVRKLTRELKEVRASAAEEDAPQAEESASAPKAAYGTESEKNEKE